MNERTRRYYREGRKAGYRASEALSVARVLTKWHAAEWAGYVQLREEDDTDYEGFCDCDDPKCSAKTGPAYGSIGEYRIDPDPDPHFPGWEVADSVWGHTGYRDVLDPWENPYVVDIMQETLDALKAALRDRCPECKGTGRRSTVNG